MSASVRALGAALAIAVVVAACGGTDQPVFGSTDSSAATGATAPGGGSSPSSTEASATLDEFDAIISASAQATSGPLESAVGTPDFAAAEAIAADLAAQGIPTDEIGIWVFPVAGTDDRLLVFEVYPSAEDIESDSDADLFEVIVSSTAIADAGITRFVFHYFDTDEEGDFVFTMSLPLEALARSVNEDADVEDQVHVEQRRIDWSTP